MKYIILLNLLFTCFILKAEKTDSIKLSNGCLYYYTYGEGEPIIVLSGGPGIASHQEDDLADSLSKQYRVILFDQRGTGRSWTVPFDSTTINLDTAIHDIEILRKHLNIKKLVIIGHSWGAMLASFYCATYPSHINKVILVGGGEIDTKLTPMVNANMMARFQLSDTTTYDYWFDSVNYARDSAKAKYEIRKLAFSRIIYDRNKLDAVMQQAIHGDVNTNTSQLLWKSFTESSKRWVDLLRQKYRGQSLIIFGWQDPVGLTTFKMYTEAFPKAKIVGINECGHMPGIEQPEIYYRELRQFLKE